MAVAKDLTPVDYDISADDMLKELQTLNKIAVLKEEETVIRGIMHGKSKNAILGELKIKHKDMDLHMVDIDNFIVLYKDILYGEKKDIENAYTRNLIKSQLGLTNKLLDLANKADSLVTKYDDAGDNSNAVNALKAAADIFMKVGKVQGIFTEGPEVNINMKMDRVVNNITSKDSEFKKSILKLYEEDEKVIEAEVIDDPAGR